MKNLGRMGLAKKTEEEKKQLALQVKKYIEKNTNPIRIIFFGSITTDYFDSASDIDIICIFKSLTEADQARRKLHNTQRPSDLPPLDIICTDQVTFDQKSKIGGIYQIASEEGKEF